MNKNVALRISLSLAAALTLQSAPLAQDEVDKAERLAAQEAREAWFSDLLSDSILAGWFTDSNQPEAPPSQDRYTLGAVDKQEDGRWKFETKIEYGDRSFSVPLLLNVVWAGDTPIITLDNLVIPMAGTFTARVLFQGEGYAGTWEGGGHGGQLMGRILRAAAEDEPPKAGETMPDAGTDEAGAGDGEGNGDSQVHWPSFRGSNARGLGHGHATVASWDLESGENVLFREPVPGLAHSSPVIWGERVFLSTAVRQKGPEELVVGLYGDPSDVEVDAAFDYVVFCMDKRSGEVLWDRLAWQGEPRFARHPKSSHASSTPATDGEHLVVSFGSEGLHCFNLDGELLWSHDLGDLDAGPFNMEDVQWGYASSPIIHGDRVLVQCDVMSQQFVAALDLATGEELWRTERDDLSSWGSPTVDVRAGRAQVLCNGYKHIGGYDLETGAELWKLVGGGDAPVPTPIVAHDLIYISNAHGPMSPIYAIHADAQGEIAMEHESMAWVDPRRGNYMQTPIVVGGELYLCSDAGILACRDALTGEEHYRERLGSGGMGFTASMVAADGKLYATSETGEVFVVRAGTEFEVLAQNSLGEECMATPAISEGVIYWRTRSQLVGIGD